MNTRNNILASLTRRALNRAARPVLETLEGRTMMSTTVLNGGSGNDAWEISALNAGDTLIVNGNGGHDTIQFGMSGDSGENVRGTVLLKNPNGTFDVVIQNNWSNTTHAVNYGHGQITGAMPGTVDYTNAPLRNVNFSLDNGGTFNIFDTRAGSNTQIQLYGNWNTLFGDVGSTTNLKGTVGVYAHGTSNRLSISDLYATSALNVAFNGNTVSGLSTGQIYWDGITDFQISTGSKDDKIAVHQLAEGAKLNVVSLGGNDTITVGETTHVTEWIRGDITLINYFGHNNLIVDDKADTDDQAQWRTTATSVELPYIRGSNILPIIHPGNADITLNTGLARNYVDVFDTVSGTTLTINAGPKNDQIKVNAPHGAVNVHAGDGADFISVGWAGGGGNLMYFSTTPVTVDGGAGFDEIAFYDELPGTLPGEDLAYHISDSGLSRTNTQVFKYTSVNQIDLFAGHGNDFIDGRSVKTHTLEIWGRDGNDTIRGGNLPDTLHGGNGNDTLNALGSYDSVYGENDNDTLIGGDGHGGDVLAGGFGINFIRADYGDTIYNSAQTVYTGTVTGTVFSDTNANGVQDANEIGLSNYLVWIDIDHDGAFNKNVDAYGITDMTGHFGIYDLPAGTFTAHLNYNTTYDYQTTYYNSNPPVTFTAGKKLSLAFGLHSKA